jgi:protein tyrosine/serine phosphatase
MCDKYQTLAMATLIALLCSVPCQAEETKEKKDTATAAQDKEIRGSQEEKTKEKTKADLPNFHEVHPFLYRGGEPTEKGLEELKKMGVSTLIDLRAASEQKIDEKAIAKRLDLQYVNLPMSSKAPTKKQIEKFFKTLEQAAKDNTDGQHKVFVHCAHGSDRTGCMIGLWRVTHDSYNYDDAYKEMRKYYFGPKFTNLSGAVKQYAHD